MPPCEGQQQAMPCPASRPRIAQIRERNLPPPGYCDAIVFEKLRFQNVSHPRENENPAFSDPFQFLERFRDGLV